MSEIDKFRHLMSAPMGDRVVLLVTFALTVLVDLTVAIQVGVVLGAVLFMHRMAEAVMVQKGVDFLQEDVDDALVPAPDFSHRALPEGVEMVSLRGPLFFGAARRLGDVLDAMTTRPRIFILRMRNVPIVNSTGVAALSDFMRRCRTQGIQVIISGLRQQPTEVLETDAFRWRRTTIFASRRISRNRAGSPPRYSRRRPDGCRPVGGLTPVTASQSPHRFAKGGTSSRASCRNRAGPNLRRSGFRPHRGHWR